MCPCDCVTLYFGRAAACEGCASAEPWVEEEWLRADATGGPPVGAVCESFEHGEALASRGPLWCRGRCIVFFDGYARCRQGAQSPHGVFLQLGRTCGCGEHVEGAGAALEAWARERAVYVL